MQGKTIGYTFTITNTGNQTLDNIKLTDSKLQSAPTINWGSPKSPTLALGKTVTATGTYTLTRDDVSNKPIENTATVTATDEFGRTVTSSASATVTPSATSSIFVSKAVSPSTVSTGDASVGETLTWKIHATNKGNQTLTGVTFHDTLDGLSALDIDWDGTQEGRIAPGKSAVATATYRLTAADVKRGYVKNEAYVTCNDLRGNSMTSNHATATATIAGKTGLSLEKTTDTPSISADEAFVGNRIKYTIKVTNTGNRKLTGLTIADDKIAPSTASPGKTELGAGESTTAIVSYAITDADIKAGKVINTATATATDSDGKTVTSNQGTATTTIETPRFDFELENTGNTTLKGISVKDALRGIGDIELERDELAAGEKTSGKATYRLTQDDIDAGFVKNSATAMAKTPTDVDVESNESSHTVTIVGSPSLSIEKKVDRESVNGTKSELRNTELTYSFTVTNTGTTTVSGIGIDDELDGLGEIKFGEKKVAPADTDGSDAADTDADGDDTDDGDDGTTDTAPDEDGNAGDSADDTDGDDDASDGEESDGKDGVSDDKGIVLAPGESIDATATYKLSDSDIEAGTVVNRAKAKGTLPNGDDIVSDESEAATKITVEADAIAAGLMQTGMTVAIPAVSAIACVSAIAVMVKRRRNRR